MIDIVGNQALSGVGATFEADAAALSVAVLTPDPVGLYLSNSGGNAWFEPGDHLILTGIVAAAEYGFGQGDGRHSVYIQFEDAAGVFYTIPELGDLSVLSLPTLCEMMDFPPEGLFIKVPTTLGRLRLSITQILLNVSMVNLPTVLDGEEIRVYYSLRIQHTLPMSVAP